ncbi:MAG: acetyl-CoA carboxylase biotin carboxyl carrier protein [Saprospiraceae bacterium]|nr:acetyl-CoA carboxylase biotin carboxyl carrier protein [Saprospiraceae bacterium]
MSFEEIQELIKLVNKSNLTDLKLKDKDFEIQIRTKKYYKGSVQTIVQSAPAVSLTPPVQNVSTSSVPSSGAEKSVTAPTESVPTQGKLTVEVKSPIVGTFYRSSAPDKPAFVKVGDTIKKGDVVCIIEAMKLFNEIESEVSGTIVKVLVEDATPVEYDQVLFLLEV